MSTTTELRRELKDRFYPFLGTRGFKRDRGSPMWQSFRKATEDDLFLLDIQWDKYHRPRFVINFGQCPAAGVQFRGKHIGPDEVMPSQASRRGRLQPGRGGSTRSWFCQDRSLIARILRFPRPRPAADVVDQLITLYSELERFWETGEKSKHVQCFSD